MTPQLLLLSLSLSLSLGVSLSHTNTRTHFSHRDGGASASAQSQRRARTLPHGTHGCELVANLFYVHLDHYARFKREDEGLFL